MFSHKEAISAKHSMEMRALIEANEKLRDENRSLKEQLSDAHSHISSLQPYHTDTTPEEVGREYDCLVQGVQDLVQKLMDPLLDDVLKGAEEVISRARSRPSDATRFKDILGRYPDLVHASTQPETDEDIIVGMILRYLHDKIFQAILFGSFKSYTNVISHLENLMGSVVQPKRDLFSVRTWTAEAYNALLSAPIFKPMRERCRKDLTLALGSALSVFCKKHRLQWLYDSIEAGCIEPAMKLYEKFQVSTHHFYLDADPFVALGASHQITPSPGFISALDKLDCRDILQNRKAFCLAKLDPQPSTQELRHNLLNVCTVTPALYMRPVGRHDVLKEPTALRKQQMLVAWGPEETRKKFRDSGNRTIVSQLYFGAIEGTRERVRARFLRRGGGKGRARRRFRRRLREMARRYF